MRGFYGVWEPMTLVYGLRAEDLKKCLRKDEFMLKMVFSVVVDWAVGCGLTTAGRMNAQYTGCKGFCSLCPVCPKLGFQTLETDDPLLWERWCSPVVVERDI